MSAPPAFEPNTTVVAVDKDKHSGYAFQWAMNHLDDPIIIAIHIRHKNITNQSGNVFPPEDDEVANIFSPLRGMCHRKSVQLRETVIEDGDIARGLSEYAHRNLVHNIVVGASNRNALARKFKGSDVPAALLKSAPDFSSVYVISKWKVVSTRPATRSLTNTALPPRQPVVQALPHGESDNVVRAQPHRRVSTSEGLETRFLENSDSAGIMPVRERPRSAGSIQSADNIDVPVRGHRTSYSHDCCLDSDELDLSGFGSMDVTKQDLGLSFRSDTSGTSSTSSVRELEAEMKRLRLELKQTMDMYSSACKQAISAKKMAKEIHQWKLEEARKVEEARLAHEAALAMAEQEKERARAALEAAEEAKKMAEMEAQRRLQAEMKARKEAEEKDRALTALAKTDIRYRKYTIDEIETATERFSLSMKIGEGGYGPVFKGRIDHTPVAIKLLNPEASQGRKQFQQEVEVLSCIRHPHMVLLLGACPDYGCLVYEYMDNGSLEDRLLRRNNSPPIPWRKRFQIAAEIATALLFLHQSKPDPLVHRDLKPANILLDKNYVSKISDVGLSRLVPPSVADSVTQYHMTSAAGTFCYIDPEYQQTGKLTTKSDIYSLGIMLLQIITARPPMGLAHHVRRAIEKDNFSEMLDPAVTDWPVEEALAFAKLALSCAELSKKDRPNLASVAMPELNRLRDFGFSTLPNDQVLSGNNQSRHMPRPPTPTRKSQSKTLNRCQDGVGEFRPIRRKEYSSV